MPNSMRMTLTGEITKVSKSSGRKEEHANNENESDVRKVSDEGQGSKPDDSNSDRS
jgi:hypothetical protein